MYFFIGIKGAGMSSLAQIMHELGYEVSGSDLKDHFFTQVGLERLNIPFYEYNKNNIKEDMIIVKGESIKDDHEEIVRAKELNLKIYSYVQMVGELTRKYSTITIAGCHGKTTTTSMIAHIFNNLLGCNYLIGDSTGYAEKNNKYFALEACEYRRHFLNYSKDIAIITNIDLDHVDYFKDIEDVIDAYQSYISDAKKYVIVCGDDPYTNKLVSDKIKYYGLDSKYDIYADNIVYSDKGTAFDCYIENNLYGHFEIPVYGKHLLLDSLAVISAAYYSGLNSDDVNREFKSFTGAQRRFSQVEVNDSIVIDDYAHHPNEVKVLLEAINQKFPNKKVIGIFQPHTFSRTKEFMNDFINIFKNIYKIYILDIHEARESQEDFPDVTSENIIKQLDNAYHLDMNEGFKVVEDGNYVYAIMSPNDLSIIKDTIIETLKESK